MIVRRSSGSRGAPPPCTFCQIVREELPSFGVFADELSVVFLDWRPLFPGHCLLVPREHHETLADLPAHLMGPLFANARLIAGAVEAALAANGALVAINNRVSQSVPHVHIHIVPRRHGDGLRGFFWPRQRYRDEAAMREVQQALRGAIAQLQMHQRG